MQFFKKNDAEPIDLIGAEIRYNGLIRGSLRGGLKIVNIIFTFSLLIFPKLHFLWGL
jgi:hypothetical protein